MATKNDNLIALRIDKALLRKIDRIASMENITRSEAIRIAMNEYAREYAAFDSFDLKNIKL